MIDLIIKDFYNQDNNKVICGYKILNVDNYDLLIMDNNIVELYFSIIDYDIKKLSDMYYIDDYPLTYFNAYLVNHKNYKIIKNSLCDIGYSTIRFSPIKSGSIFINFYYNNIKDNIILWETPYPQRCTLLNEMM